MTATVRTVRDQAVADALEGKHGRNTPKPGEPGYLNLHTRNVLADLAATSGVALETRPYLIRRMRYHLGAGTLPPRPAAGGLTDWVNARAWDLLDEHRHLLPALADHTAPEARR